jgi:hypothetical protein
MKRQSTPQERKTTLYSAQDVSAAGIQKHIVQDRILVLNAKVNTTQSCVKRIRILQQNAEETIRPTTEVASYIKLTKSKKQNNSTKMKLHSITSHKY